jgi:hypothetical protein
MARYLRPHALYLVEAPEVPMYYLGNRPDAQPRQFISTFGLSVVTKQGKRLSGDGAFKYTVRQGWYQIVAYNGVSTPATDRLLRRYMVGAPYTLKKVVSASSHGNIYNYYVWVKMTQAELNRLKKQNELRAKQQAQLKRAKPAATTPSRASAPGQIQKVRSEGGARNGR